MNDQGDFEALKAVAVEVGRAAAAEALKHVSHEYPSEACQLVLERLISGLNRRLDSIDTRLDIIKKDLDEVLESQNELEKRIKQLEDGYKDLHNFKSMQIGAVRVMWTFIVTSGAGIIGAAAWLIKHLLASRP